MYKELVPIRYYYINKEGDFKDEFELMVNLDNIEEIKNEIKKKIKELDGELIYINCDKK